MMELSSAKSRVILSLVLILAAASGQVQSANFRWLNFSPERYFSDEDWEMMTSTANEALNQGKDGAEYSWTNPKTGSSGSITPSPAASHDEQPCRTLSITNNAGGLTATGKQRLCKQPNGEWKIAP